MSAEVRLREHALALGFDAVAIARVAPLEAQRRYEAWLAAGHHGDMAWLGSSEHRARRADPSRLLAGVQSVVCVALHHEPQRDVARDARLGRIARYAAGEDYHRIMRERLGALEVWIRGTLLPGSLALGYADTGALLERAWAERAGLGWTGKHAGLIARERGSWFLLGEVLVDRPLTPDLPEGGAPAAGQHCGSCTRCIDLCPTRAIVAPFQVDARRCISYLTIEHEGAIPRALRPLIGDWVFGCDVCQEVCPWNRFAPPARESRLHARALEGWSLARFLQLDEASFGALFESSPIRRAGRAGFLRNVCVALGNRADSSAAPALERALGADRDALVRAHAAWALGEIAASAASLARPEAVLARSIAADALREAASRDPDGDVREEAALAMARAG